MSRDRECTRPDMGPAPSPRGLAWLPALVLYQFVFVVLAVAYTPLLAWRLASRRRYRGGVLERIGFVPKTTGAQPVLWIHAVSVGELKAARRLIEAIAARGEYEVVVSSTTPTGRALARLLYPSLRTFYYPFDLGPCPWLALRRVRPAAVLLVELEYWPNFLFCAARRGIPVAVVNGRISERSYRGYRRIRGLLPPFEAIARFCMQDESYRQRLLGLGVDPARVFVSGNMKYDAVTLGREPARAGDLRRWLSGDGRAVLVCGSTHGDEERLLLAARAQVEASLQRPVRLVLVPRHPERAVSVRDEITALGCPCVRWSEVGGSLPALESKSVVLVDTIGHLESFYGACDVAYVGGSLVPRGGQNMLEPAALGRAVVFGPYTTNFRNDVELLLGAGGAIQVASAEGLVATLLALLSDPTEAQELGKRAVALIERNQGATTRTLDLLDEVLGRHPALEAAGSGTPHEAR